MKLFSVISTKKYAGKTFFSSLFIKSLLKENYKTAYYKPFQMNIIENYLPDINYIRKTTTLAPSDIYSTYALPGYNAPFFASEREIDIREIRDFIVDTDEENIYDIMMLEGIGIYEPLDKNNIFIDTLSNTLKVKNDIILLAPYDENIIEHLLLTVEGIYRNSLNISMIVINQKENIEIKNHSINYLKKLLYPIEVYILPYIEDNDDKENIAAEFHDIKNKILSMM